MPSLYRYQSDTFRSHRLGTAKTVARIRRSVRSGQIATDEYILKENERLDQIAHLRYGDGRLWWIIAAASNIGWPLQAPPGTILQIPIDINEISRIM